MHDWKPYLKVGVAVLALVFAGAVELLAQEDEEKEPGWADSAELSFVATAGNAEARTLGFRNVLTRVWIDAELVVEAKGLRAETATITRTALDVGSAEPDVTKTSVSEVTAENYLVRGRYDRNVSERTFWFATGSWNRNEFAGIRNRVQAAGGMGNAWLDSSRRRFRTTYGLSVTHQVDVVGADGPEDTFTGLRATAEYWRKLTGNTELETNLIVDENLNQTEDLRFEWVSSVNVSMTDHLALKVSLGVQFDKLPSLVDARVVDAQGNLTGRTISVPADKVDTDLTTALVFSF